MIRNHLLGLPYIFGMERPPTPPAVMADPAKTPSQIAAKLEEQRRIAQAEDAKAYADMKAPPAPAPREEPYRPEGFDFQYHGPKGQSGEVIPKRPEPAALRGPVDPLDALAERVVNDDGMYRRLIEHRGGCSCHIAPCSACSSPLTLAEAEALGWLESESIITPLAPSKPAAAEVPEGATHRDRNSGTLYRHIKTGETYVWHGSAWAESTCHWSDEEMARGCFEHLPQPAAPEPQQ